jgi:predicted aldo/keto reductase-like oxidoreductase
MSDVAQVIENAALADGCAAGSLTDEEQEVYRRVREVFNASYKVHCTGCNYCMPCPKGVNIPDCFAAYNTSFSMGWFTGIKQYVTGIAGTSVKVSGPANCVACGKCETHCPQKLPIIENLKAVRKRMEPLFIRIIIVLVRKILGK